MQRVFRFRTSTGILTSALVCVVTQGCSTDVPTRYRAPAVDHHLHIRTQAAAEHLDRLSLMLEAQEPIEGSPSPPLTAEDVLAALDSAGVERGLLLSNAYMFGMPDLPVENERQKVRAENDYVAQQAAGYSDRLVAFCSVNPLQGYALEEIAYCADDERVDGLKLHFANSNVDLRDPAHVQRLQEIFERIDRQGLPMVVHMRTRREDYGAADARVFIDQVLPHAPRIPIQIAHAAGWGGYDDATDAALGEFADAFVQGRADPSRLSFDLGAVVFQPEAAGGDTALVAMVRRANERLAARMRAMGVERFVYATDWPSWPPVPDPVVGIAANARLIRAALPLAPDELDRLFANVSVVLSSR